MNNNYDSKIKLCEKFGARKFQKIVFNVEKTKFKIINKLFPNINVWYTNYTNHKCNKYIKRHPNKDSLKIKQIFLMKKIYFKEELNSQKNTNYHFKANNPLDFYYWLNWNKNVHIKGIVTDGLFLALLSVYSILFSHTIVIELAELITLLSALINFQCINLQNYNIYRFKKNEKRLQENANIRNNQDIKKYSNISNKVVSIIKEKGDIPNPNELIANINDKEELKELKNMLISMRNRENSDIIKNKKLERKL